jgi:hypothetical protein
MYIAYVEGNRVTVQSWHEEGVIQSAVHREEGEPCSGQMNSYNVSREIEWQHSMQRRLWRSQLLLSYGIPWDHLYLYRKQEKGSNLALVSGSSDPLQGMQAGWVDTPLPSFGHISHDAELVSL